MFFSIKSVAAFNAAFIMGISTGLAENESNVATEKTVSVHKISSPIIVDGKADEAAWQKAEAHSLNNFYKVKSPSDKQNTIVKFLWSSENLYLHFECKDQYLTAREMKLDGMPFFDDCAEIFLIPTTDRIKMHFGFEINLNKKPNDFVYLNDLYRGKNITIKSYNPIYTFETQVDGTINDNSDIDSGWSIEMAIPLQSFRTAWAIPTVKEGSEWAFMAARQDRNELKGKRIATSTLFPITSKRGSIHNPERFGVMRFLAD